MYAATQIHASKQCGGKGRGVSELDRGEFRLRPSFLSLAAGKGIIRRVAERAGSFHLSLGGSDWAGSRHSSHSPSTS